LAVLEASHYKLGCIGSISLQAWLLEASYYKLGCIGSISLQAWLYWKHLITSLAVLEAFCSAHLILISLLMLIFTVGKIRDVL